MVLNTQKVSLECSGLCQICKSIDDMYSCLLCNKIICIRCIQSEYFCIYCHRNEKNFFTIIRILKEIKKKDFYDKYPFMRYLCFIEKKNEIKPL
jgi:hypothetical protein